MSSMSNTRKDIAERLGSAQPNDRPGAKAKFGNVDRLESLMAACYRALKNNDKAAAKRLIEDASKEIDSSIPAYIVSEYRDLRRSMHNSRPGVKAKFNWKESTTKINDDLNVALQAINANDLDKAIRYIKQAQTRAFYIFDRPGVKAKFEATPALKNFVRQWNRLEDQNYHSECVLLISKFIGTPQDVANSQRLIKIMDKGFDPSANVELGEISDRLWKQVGAKYGRETVNKLMGY